MLQAVPFHVELMPLFQYNGRREAIQKARTGTPLAAAVTRGPDEQGAHRETH